MPDSEKVIQEDKPAEASAARIKKQPSILDQAANPKGYIAHDFRSTGDR